MTWLDHQISQIVSWWRMRRLMHAIPGYAATFTQEFARKRSHGRIRECRAERQRLLHEALRVKA